MPRYLTLCCLLGASIAAWTATRPEELPFAKHMIDAGASEACAVADINGDKLLDIVSGEHWYEAPKWVKHRFRSLGYSNYYIDNFSDLPVDVDADGRVDIVSGSYFSKRLAWYKNTGKGEWPENVIDTGFSNEFIFLVDLNNDGKALELLPQAAPNSTPLAWYELDKGKWKKHVVSPNSYGHGIGAGDVNGDKRTDILTPKGWFEAPPDPRSGQWTWHADWDSTQALGFLYVLDVNGDGRNDVVTSAAHDYGIYWLERGEGNQWTKRMIDDSWSQPHAMTMADVNQDGRMDLVTGKRYMAHNGRDPGEREPLGIYWYEYIPGTKIEWVKHVVDYGTRAGGGMQIPVIDLDGDGDRDFVVAGKSGLFVFENLSKRK
jgi:hypothetical protein